MAEIKLTEQEITENLSTYRIYMIDDTKNRVLSDDNVIITGIYRHSAKTFSDCTYELLN